MFSFDFLGRLCDFWVAKNMREVDKFIYVDEKGRKDFEEWANCVMSGKVTFPIDSSARDNVMTTIYFGGFTIHIVEI